jgi:septal ring factor EnvC (AmiA/AmiB activator)
MDDRVVAYAVGILGGLGALVKTIFDALASREKQGNEISSTRIKALEDKVDALHKDHADCLQRAVEAATELRILKARLVEVEKENRELRAEVDRLNGLLDQIRTQ